MIKDQKKILYFNVRRPYVDSYNRSMLMHLYMSANSVPALKLVLVCFSLQRLTARIIAALNKGS